MSFTKNAPANEVLGKLLGFESEVGDFGWATEPEREPRAIADVNIADRVADFDDSTRIFEDGKQRNTKNAELRAVSMPRERQNAIIFGSVVDKFRVMRQKYFNCVVGDIFERFIDKIASRVGENFFLAFIGRTHDGRTLRIIHAENIKLWRDIFGAVKQKMDISLAD